MSDADTRQKAEDHYYAALDLMADGKWKRRSRLTGNR